jgi:TatD DNase family protein
MLIDTHCHLDFKDFDADRADVITRAKAAGVDYMINVGASLEGTLKSLEIAKKNSCVYVSAGIHPHEADRTGEDDLISFKKIVDENKVAAIGEIGLDYYKNFSSKDNQKKLFAVLLKEAKDRELPVIIHDRDAHADTLDILKEVMGRDMNGVIHCFSGDSDFLKQCLAAGLYISFTGVITFKNAGALRETAKLVPMERLMLETDAPFLAPQIFRGKRNEPAYVKYLAEEISRIKGLSFEEVARVTTENAGRLFRINIC